MPTFMCAQGPSGPIGAQGTKGQKGAKGDDVSYFLELDGWDE